VNTHCIENFFTVHDFWATCACPEKIELPWNFSLYWIYLLYSVFLSNLRLPWKQSCLAFTVLNIYFYIQDFWATCACLENRACPEIFHCIEYTFYIQDFWATLRLPWKQSCLAFTVLNIYFYIQDFWATCACLENRVCPEIFHCIECTFYIQDIWATCACPEKKRVSWEFSLCWIYFSHSGFLSNLCLSWK